jgi:glycine reductase
MSFGSQTRYVDGHLQVDKARVIEAVMQDPRIASADLDLAFPGESVRIWPVRDLIEPRIKVNGPGVIYPGACGRSITTVGEVRTHPLSGMGIDEVSSDKSHDACCDYV